MEIFENENVKNRSIRKMNKLDIEILRWDVAKDILLEMIKIIEDRKLFEENIDVLIDKLVKSRSLGRK